MRNDRRHPAAMRPLWLRAMLLLLGFGLLLLAQAPGSSASEGPLRLVVLGDSLVAGYNLAPGEAFPERLQAALQARGMDVVVENAGVSGDTTSSGLARLDWSVGEDTDAVLLELGANDALRGIAPELTRQNLDRIISLLKERGIAVMLAGMLAPPNMGSDYAARFNPIYGELASRHAIALYPFFLDGVAADPDMNQADGMHPTARGVDRIVERILPDMEAFLEPLLAR